MFKQLSVGFQKQFINRLVYFLGNAVNNTMYVWSLLLDKTNKLESDKSGLVPTHEGNHMKSGLI